MAVDYKAAVLALNPVAYWRMDDVGSAGLLGAGQTLTASVSGTGNMAPVQPWYTRQANNLTRSAWCMYAYSGRGMQYSNGTSYAFEWNQPFSIAAWIYGRGMGITAYSGLWSKATVGGTYRGYNLYVDGGNRFACQLTNDSNSSNYVDRRWAVPASITVNSNWSHLAWVYDGSGNRSGINLYIDGVVQAVALELANATISSTIVDSAAPFSIGEQQQGGPLNTVNIGDLTIFNRALTASDLSALIAFAPSYDARTTQTSQHVIRSVSRPARNLVTAAGATTSAELGASRLNRGVN
jgi:hypothetical protein